MKFTSARPQEWWIVRLSKLTKLIVKRTLTTLRCEGFTTQKGAEDVQEDVWDTSELSIEVLERQPLELVEVISDEEMLGRKKSRHERRSAS